MDPPPTRYTKTVDGVHVAYQVCGSGPLDLVLVNSAYSSNMENCWGWDPIADGFRWLADRGRLVNFDRRGTGLSDRVRGGTLPSVEARMDDIRAVMDASGVERAVLFGVEDGAAQCFLFAATYPERTAALIALTATSRGVWAPDSPWHWTEDRWRDWLNEVDNRWGEFEFASEATDEIRPDKAGDADFIGSYARMTRHSMSPGEALEAERMYRDTDVRHVLPVIQAPTLVVHGTDDPVESIEEARWIATHIPGAKLAEFPGNFHWWPLALRATSADVDRFLGTLRDVEAEFERSLATVMFTDIVGSTRAAATLGDRAWGALLERHHAFGRAMIGRYHGVEVDTAGDGFFATFDGPARAVRCAHAIVDAVRALDIEIRAGVHTGEVETIDGKVGGIAVNIGARVGALAGASEVLVSQTVKDLTAGSGLAFEDAGEYELKGVPDRWRVYRAIN
jgi:class 3 adenylate cyclase/pimeloyl-ACP methyl ester carboxylesterase